MKTKRAGCIVGIGLLALAGSANANTVPLTETKPGPLLAAGDTGVILTETQQGLFEEQWYFRLATALAGLTGSITSINISGLEAELTNLTTGTVVAEGLGPNFSVSSLAKGNYELEIEGNANGIKGGGVSGQLTAVPVPAAAWLFLSGLVAMGLVARRRGAG